MSIFHGLRRKLTFTVFGLMVLVGGLGIGISLIQRYPERQSEASGAKFLSATTTNKAAELVAEIASQTAKEKAEFKSNAYNYAINYDPNYWSRSLGTTRSREVKFELLPVHGLGSVKITVSESGELDDVGSELDAVAAFYEGKKVNSLPASVRYAGKELINRQGIPEYKLTFVETYLGKENEYYEYLSVRDDLYYVIEAKYSKLTAPKVLTEAFIDSIESFGEGTGGKVKGLITKKDEPPQILEEAKIAELAKPSVVNILSVYCNSIEIPDTTGARYLKSTYKFCGGNKGSGFFVNGEGYIATNGHIVKVYPEGSLVSGILFGTIDAFARDLIAESVYLETGMEMSPEQAQQALILMRINPLTLDSLLTLVYALLDEDFIKIQEGGKKYYVKLADDPIKFDEKKIESGDWLSAVYVSDTIREAELVDFDYPNFFSAEAILNESIPIGTDVAVIKIKDARDLTFPSLVLGSVGDIKSGSKLLIIGYPGLVEGTSSGTSLLSESSSALPTVTQGIVSSIKTDKGGRTLVQTDASIDHGNSGGPAFDQYGKVVGIATYGFESLSGNYNFLRDIKDLKDLLDKNGISASPSETYNQWSEGLSYFWRNHYKRAIRPFGEVKTLYDIHPLANSYVTDARAAIERGEDESGILGSFGIYLSPRLMIYISGAVLAIGLIGIIILLLKKQKPPTPAVPVSGISPVLPQGQQPVQPPSTQPQPQQTPGQVGAQPSVPSATPYQDSLSGGEDTGQTRSTLAPGIPTDRTGSF